jgi:2-amino-4-hydroxy-6-hydroxymethyldihydropteridine diphosphokinase
MVMHQVILSLGANYQAEKNLPEAQKSLGQILFSPHYTDAIWTEPIASKRTDLYLNQLVKAQT